VGAHHGVLHHFLGIEGVLQDAVGIGEERLLKSIDEPLEGPRVSSTYGDGEIVAGLAVDDLAAGPRVLHIPKNTGGRSFVRGACGATRRLLVP
jgi:hypothetical protein